MPNVPTFLPWYADQKKYVLEHMDSLIFKDVSSDRRAGAVYGDTLTTEEKRQLARRINKEPRRYIAQNQIEVETQPVLGEDGVSTSEAKCDFRAYTVHSDSLRVWMGGLSRFTVKDSQGQPVSGFKDTWVMSK